MAKQPHPDQLDQMLKDMRVTAARSQIPAVKASAEKIVPLVEQLAAEFRRYVDLAGREYLAGSRG